MTRRSDARRGPLEDLNEARRSAPPVAGDPVAEIELILERVRRLRYDHNNPERFHAERSDIAGAIGGLLKRMRAGGQPIGAALFPERHSSMQARSAHVEVHFAPRRGIFGPQRETLRIVKDRP